MAGTILTTFPRRRLRGTICIRNVQPRPFNQEAPMLNRIRTIGLSAACLVVLLLSGRASSGDLEHVNVYASGADGYNTFRIPTIETAPDGTILAFAEARKYNAGDPGMENNEIDLVLKRSKDGGKTWSEAIPLHSDAKTDNGYDQRPRLAGGANGCDFHAANLRCRECAGGSVA